MRHARSARCLLIMTMLLGLGGCGQAGVRDGHALGQDFPISTGDKPIRPGTEIGLLDVYFENGSSSTVTITSVGITGLGIGTVIRPVEVRIAPLRFGRHRYEKNATPSSLYTSDPPVLFYGTRCHRQALFPVKGYRMPPGSQVRVWIVLRALRPGKWVIPRHVIYYTVGGSRYRQAVPLREYGSVTAHAAYIPPERDQVRCMKQEDASFLAGYHSGRVSD
jgi:hypothetical protein